nr:histidine kinase [uncultured Eisenbergiella sp.]
MKNRKVSRMVMAGIGIIIVALICGYGVALHFSENIEKLEVKKLEDTARMIDKTLFENNVYLMPDTAYFYKLEYLLQTGKQVNDEGNFANMIRKNLSKGVLYDSNIYSVYTALAREETSYIMVNGTLRQKDAMTDMQWWETCRDMEGSCYMDWREINSSFLNKVKLFSVYRIYDSISYKDGRVVQGYMVINYYRSHILNEINTLTSSDEGVILYNPISDQLLCTDGDSLTEADVREMLSQDPGEGILQGSGVRSTRDHVKMIYSISGSDFVPLYYIILKKDTEVSKFMSEIYFLMLGIVSLICFGFIVFLLLYYYQYQKYLSGLVQVIKAVEQDGTGEEKMLTDLSRDLGGKKMDLHIIARKILDDNMDINELKRALSSEQRLRTEVEMLYGHAQINSHFLLNTLDSIYWESLKNNGSENGETRMIERLCLILKYALDSSNPYISLEEEVDCAKEYLAIQQFRKNQKIDAKWEIPQGLRKAKVGKLILQPILENSIQHGGFSKGVPVFLRVEAKLMEDILYLLVSDNGIGMEENEMRRMNQIFREDIPVRSKHIGLMNVNRRIQLQYGDKYGIVLQPSVNGVGLTVLISLKYLIMEEENQE